MDNINDETYCYYSDLPSPMAYIEREEQAPIRVETIEKEPLSLADIDRIIEMAWEDRTSFDVIKKQFGLSESAVKAIMKQNMKHSSYVLWRKRVENCKTKHAKKRVEEIDRFKSKAQRTITSNKISKRK